MRRWLVLAILLACKGDKKEPAPQPGAPDPVAPPAAKPSPTVAAPPRPVLEPPKPSKAANEEFENEPRDGEWAAAIETGIKSRFEKVRGGKLEVAECRKSRCRLTITGSEGDLAQTISDLEGPRGLHGYAKNVLLTAPIQKSDGSIELRAIAVFDR